MKNKAKSKSLKSGNTKSKTKRINLNEKTEAAADHKEKTAVNAVGSITTPRGDAPPKSSAPLDENEESDSNSDHETTASHAKGNPEPDIAEPSEPATPLEVIVPGGSKPPAKRKKTGVEDVAAEHDKLSDLERTTLKECLEVIHEGIDTFVQVGSAIATIIAQKLYRESHQTFQRYANEVLGISPRRAYQLKDASEVIDNLKQANTRSHEDGGTAELQMPTNENQVRALKEFPPDVQCEIWRDAVKAAGEKKVTGKVLAQVIEARAKSAHETAADPAQKESSKDEDSTFEKEIEKVIATLNHAWKILPEAHHRALLDRVSNWLASAREAD